MAPLRSTITRPSLAFALLAGLVSSACSFDTSTAFPDRVEGDGGEPRADGAEDDPRTHLLLSEIKHRSSGQEFIEIYNPGQQSVSLANYFVADHQEYALLPQAIGGPVDRLNSDFVVGFPAGSSIDSKQARVIAISPSNFSDTYSYDFDFAIVAPPSEEEEEDLDPVSDSQLMQAAFAGAIGGRPSITDSGEMVVLLHWDGQSDLVHDVDLVNGGLTASEGNLIASKAGIAVDGPDPDSATSAYAAEALTLPLMSSSTTAEQSYQRIQLEAGHELRNVDSNGLFGDDETSEDLHATWQLSESPTPGSVGL